MSFLCLAMGILVHVFRWSNVLIYLGYIPESRIAGSWGMHMFSFKCFQNGCISLHFLQHCVDNPVLPCPHQLWCHLSFSSSPFWWLFFCNTFIHLLWHHDSCFLVVVLNLVHLFTYLFKKLLIEYFCARHCASCWGHTPEAVSPMPTLLPFCR